MNRETADDDSAFRALFEAAYDDLLLFVERRTHLAVADDVVAETFLTAWRRWDEVPASLDDARAWLFTVARNILRNRQRSDQRQQSLALRILREPDAASGAEDDAVATRVDLARAWLHLSPADQEILTLTAIEDLTGPQAAAVLGIARPAFSLRLLRARRRLREHLRRQPGPEPTTSPAPAGRSPHGGSV
ncbi:RNA polymerase sigma factor [Actinoplanes sp. M2I2]|uniref:RNA polymerase sigma factor n=1 Tax=Actinoplanes sp. M2I2 TaxID=1734444 RepID=UPI0020202CB1|nr:RNA polymerase sigma factor [Actinoplanes sp. M2I2]